MNKRIDKDIVKKENSLNRLISLFSELQIQYWIDSGTLLGMYREKRLIVWDDDIDIGVWEDFLSVFTKNKKLFTQKGFTISSQAYHDRIYSITLKTSKNKSSEDLPIHIHIYSVTDGFAWSPQVVACQQKPKPQQDWAIQNPSKMRDFLLWCKRYAKLAFSHSPVPLSQRIMGLFLCMPVWGLFYVIKAPLDREKWANQWPISLIYRIYTWKIPAEYFKNLTIFKQSGMEISAPSDIEDYLALRYGDWQVPNANWVYWRDDKTLISENPETVFQMEGP